ncbi:ATP-binding protein [Glycomyces arizonensis]|uniref:ATP-binding protein n=1 Tax=Glycomyces arizonensis TaxID=256035 RepID=UPI0004009C98|nr:HAMP domain-containing sensor histidine kinase [Glycomyces arizonensis]
MNRLRGATVGLRFAILYSAVFLASGLAMLTLAFLLSGGTVGDVEPVPGQHPLGDGDPTAAQQRIGELQDQLAASDARQARNMLIGSLLALLVMAIVSPLVGRMLAGRVLRPLRRITEQTRHISADDLDKRLGATGPADEVKDLADTIDGLLERLEASFTAQRRFVANASHELRTPLATMRASLDVAVAKPDVGPRTLGLIDRIRPQLDQVEGLLDGLLALAQAQHGALGGTIEVDVSELVRRALAGNAEAIAAKGLNVTEGLPHGMRTRGDAALLSRMVANVVDNAVVHNVQGGWIHVATELEGDDIRLAVLTGGRVLDPREVDGLEQPFRRLGSDRTGSGNGAGLGLSIVESIASAHGGRLALTAPSEGGLLAAITLPAVAVPAEAKA